MAPVGGDVAGDDRDDSEVIRILSCGFTNSFLMQRRRIGKIFSLGRAAALPYQNLITVGRRCRTAHSHYAFA